jgi:hypothetical protein
MAEEGNGDSVPLGLGAIGEAMSGLLSQTGQRGQRAAAAVPGAVSAFASAFVNLFDGSRMPEEDVPQEEEAEEEQGQANAGRGAGARSSQGTTTSSSTSSSSSSSSSTGGLQVAFLVSEVTAIKADLAGLRADVDALRGDVSQLFAMLGQGRRAPAPVPSPAPAPALHSGYLAEGDVATI